MTELYQINRSMAPDHRQCDYAVAWGLTLDTAEAELRHLRLHERGDYYIAEDGGVQEHPPGRPPGLPSVTFPRRLVERAVKALTDPHTHDDPERLLRTAIAHERGQAHGFEAQAQKRVQRLLQPVVELANEAPPDMRAAIAATLERCDVPVYAAS